MSRSRRTLLAVVAAVSLVALAGCNVTTEVAVFVDRDGSGWVEVAVGLDGEAVSSLPDLDSSGDRDEQDVAALVRTADLEQAGWEIGSPTREDGTVWVRVTKPFGSPEEANRILAELTGPDSRALDLELERSTSFGTDRFTLSGTADLGGGLAAFSDDGLAAALGGAPLGEDVAAIEERFGQPVPEMFDLVVRAELPGDVAGSWSPRLGGEPQAVEASSTVYDSAALGLAGVAALCAVALLVLFAVRTVRTSGARR